MTGLQEAGSGWRVLYFACLGLGFMFIEIGLLRRFILFLGPPIYSLAVILCSLLVSSGLGALCSARLPTARLQRWLPGILLALVLLSVVYVLRSALDARPLDGAAGVCPLPDGRCAAGASRVF